MMMMVAIFIQLNRVLDSVMGMPSGVISNKVYHCYLPSL
jgi:hypothetical protein